LPLKAAGIGALSAGVVLGSGLALAFDLGHRERHRHQPPGLGRITALSAEARRPVPPARPGVRFLRTSFGDGTWNLAYSGRGGLLCFVLVVPRTSNQGTCGRPGQFRRQKIVVTTLARKAQGGSTLFVVYGWTVRGVRQLELTLSDCTRLPVGLGSRPLFWRFIPASLLRRGIYPTGFVATLNGHEEMQGRLVTRDRPTGETLCTR
jgi:hypothetical protein